MLKMMNEIKYNTEQLVIDIRDLQYDDMNVFLPYISGSRRERISRFRFDKDKIRAVIAEIIIRYALITRTGCDNDSIEFGVGEKGKPYIINSEFGIEFNISHAGDYVACAVSDAPVGIDVEHIRNKDISFANRIMTSEERENLIKLEESARTEAFYKLWTIKESYTKLLGLGFFRDFETVNTKNAGEYTIAESILEDGCKSDKAYIYSQQLAKDYFLSVSLFEDHIGTLKKTPVMLDFESLIIAFGR